MGYTALVSDSTAGLTTEYVTRHQIQIVPLYLNMGEKSLREGIELEPSEFYQLLPKANPLPTTSQPSAGDFTTAYQSVIDRGATSIISVHISAGLSGTINSATLAAQQFPGVPIEIIDSRTAAAAPHIAVQTGAQALADGSSFEEATRKIRAVLDSQRTIFAVDTLEYLYKGGRIGGAAALFGSLLQMKPLLYLKEGKIDALERVRGSVRAMTRMTEVLVEWLGTTEPMRVIVMHSNCQKRGEEALELVRSKLNVAVGQLVLLTPVIGAHVGPGTVGVCCCPVSVCGAAPDFI
ncbi:MAG: DegV family protein [Anaerolineae bacterium]